MTGLPTKNPVVIVIDDDEEVRGALANLLASVGLDTITYGTAAEMMEKAIPDAPGCLILDIRLPGIGGLEFQAHLKRAGVELPIVFITGYGDVPMSVRAMKAGAADFLTKPFRDQDLIEAVTAAIAQDRKKLEARRSLDMLRERYRTLTPREVEIMWHVSKGLLNKQMAGELGLAEITVKAHRGNLMRKMEAKSLAHLVRMAVSLGMHQGS